MNSKLWLVILLVTFCGSGITQNLEKRKIAVVSIQAHEGISQGEAEILADRLRTELINTGKFSVMERDQMDEVLKEQGFQLSGCITNECLIQAGKILSVREIIVGSVGKFGDVYTISLRIIDVETGEIIDSKSTDTFGNKSDLLTVYARKLAEEFAGVLPAPSVKMESNPRESDYGPFKDFFISEDKEDWLGFHVASVLSHY